MISAGVEGRLPYMTYPEPWRGPPKQPPEFLRPAPKPLPTVNRYNGLSNGIPNGTRLGPPLRSPSKYSSPPAASPVNLTQQKEELSSEDLQYNAYSRLFAHPPPFSPYHANPYGGLYQSPYPQIMRPNYVQPPPLSPLETTYSPTTPTSGTFLSPQSTFSPPSSVKPGQSLLRDRKLQPSSFKVPSGKEGSLKHRILTRPEDAQLPPRSPLDLQRGDHVRDNRKRLTATAISPPQSPAKPLNNNTLPAKFAKGSLISLATGELRRVEDMRTEDFVLSAQRSPELRLADSTVVRIEENPITGTATITLSYNQRRTQVEVESALEHPFFVYGVGWASCNAERTLQCYGLKVHRLQVGDILISLTPRETHNTNTNVSLPPSRSSTIITTATTTAMTVRQTSTNSMDHHQQHIVSNLIKDHSVKKDYNNHNTSITINQQVTHPSQSLSPDSLSRKRRWSAPEQICDEEELMQPPRRIRME